MRYFNIAGLNTAIDDTTGCGKALCDYFSGEELKSAPGTFDLIVRMAKRADDVKVDARYTAVSGKFRFNKDAYSVKDKYYTYAVKHLFGGGTPELLIHWRRRGTPVNAVRDLVKSKTIGAGSEEQKFLETILNYSMFWYILAIVLLNHGKCFIHSAIFSENGKATVLAGSAGCGKTSTLLSVMEKPESRYLDEDFGILGSDGFAYYIAKRVTVYEEDAAFGSPVIKKALQTLKTGTKGAWNFYRTIGMNKRVKFHPESIFPGQVEQKLPIGSVVFVSRGSSDRPRRIPVTKEVMADKMMCVSFRELKTLYELLNNIRGVGDEEIRAAYPAVRDLEDRYLAVMNDILQKADSFRFVETPLKSGPQVTLEAISL